MSEEGIAYYYCCAPAICVSTIFVSSMPSVLCLFVRMTRAQTIGPYLIVSSALVILLCGK